MKLLFLLKNGTVKRCNKREIIKIQTKISKTKEFTNWRRRDKYNCTNTYIYTIEMDY